MKFFNGEARKEAEEQQKQMNFQREQNMTQGSLDPRLEQLYMQEREQREDLLRWQQNLQGELFDLRMRLKNNYWNGDEWVSQTVKRVRPDGKVYEENIPAMINEIGISMIESQIAPLISRNIINSRLNEQQINTILKRTSRAIKNDLVVNYDNYEVTPMNPATFSRIMSLAKNTIIPSPNRSRDGWNKRMDNSAFRFHETGFSGGRDEQKSGILGFTRWRK